MIEEAVERKRADKGRYLSLALVKGLVEDVTVLLYLSDSDHPLPLDVSNSHTKHLTPIQFPDFSTFSLFNYFFFIIFEL